MDMQRLRVDFKELNAQLVKEKNLHERAIKDMTYQHEEMFAKLNEKIADIDELHKQLAIQTDVTRMREQEIGRLKGDVEKLESQNRGLVKEITRLVDEQAQNNIDDGIDIMVKRPPNLESQHRKGIVSTTQDRFQNLV